MLFRVVNKGAVKNDHTIWIELPNSTMKKEVEREQSLMLNYLKEKPRLVQQMLELHHEWLRDTRSR